MYAKVFSWPSQELVLASKDFEKPGSHKEKSEVKQKNYTVCMLENLF